MLMVGCYLFVVAIIGTYVRSFGGTWGGALEVALLVGSVSVLVVIALSAEARAIVRVFVQKYFVSQKYDYREEWLRFVRTIDGDGPALDRNDLGVRVLRAMANITGSPDGGLWIHNENDEFVPVAGRLCGANAPTFENGRTEDHWVELLTQNNWIMDVGGQLPPGLERQQIPEWLLGNPQVWLVVPLGVSGRMEGLVVLEPPLSNDRMLTWEDLDLLRTAATQSAGSLALQRALDDIGQLQQFEAFNRLVAFLMHDLKNVLAQQQLVVKNFPRFRNNPEFIDDAILTVDNATQRMARLIEQLKGGADTPQRRRFRFDEACREALRSVSDRTPRPVAVQLPVVSVSGDPERLRSALVHLLRNAQDATADDGEVSFHAEFADGLITVIIADTGEGMSEEFIRNRLFKPFESTKGVMGMGVGAYQAREYIRELGGELQVESQPKIGTRFTLTIPALATDDIGELALAVH
jgi:putative PEP-CTERM system histidine kinase